MAGIDTEWPGGPGVDSRPPGHAEIGQAAAADDGAATRKAADRWGGWLVAGGPALVALVSYGYRLGGPPLWRDEATTKDMSGRPAGEILATLHHYDAVHGAYYLVMHFAARVTGNSAAALRVPSLLAMVLACAFTALTARRLAALVGEPRPWLTGVAAGLVLALLPGATRYAQEARSYALVTMGAAIATYLLLRAAAAGGRWWAWYGATVALLGVVNIFGLLILLAHGLSLLIAGPGRQAGHPGRRPRLGRHGRPPLRQPTVGRLPVGWVAAAIIALAAAAPVLTLAYAQRAALTWKSAPPVGLTAARLIRFWSGSWGMTAVICALAAVAIVTAARSAWTGRRHGSAAQPGGTEGRPLAGRLGQVSVALPLLAAPPAVLLAVSQTVPVYDNRYVEFCLPGLAILAGCGLSLLVRLAAAAPLRRAGIGWLPAAAAGVALLVLAMPGEALVRQPGARGDNLVFATQVIADNARPGDVVLYVPSGYRTVSMPFPGPWRVLRDISLRRSPARSDTLYGTSVTPAQLRARFRKVPRVWLIAPPTANYAVLVRQSPLYAAEARLLAGLRVLHRWDDHDVVITLYTTWHGPSAATRPGGGGSG